MHRLVQRCLGGRLLPLHSTRIHPWFRFIFSFELFYLDILNELLQRENRVLHFWTLRKRRLDQCQQYVVFERSAKQVDTTPAYRLS